MEDITEPVRIGKMVQYQSRRNPDEWHAFHVNLRMDDYEYFMDMKKLLKMSISLMLANAVEKYLNEILTKKLSDNYQFKNYTVIKEIIDNIIIWKFIWGFPRNIGRLII